MTVRQEIEHRLATLQDRAATPEPTDAQRWIRRLSGIAEVSAKEASGRAARNQLPVVEAELRTYNARHPHFTADELESAKANLREVVRLLAKLRADKDTAESNLSSLKTTFLKGDPVPGLEAEDVVRRAKTALVIMEHRLGLLATGLAAAFSATHAAIGAEVDRLRQVADGRARKGLAELGFAVVDLDDLAKRHPYSIAVNGLQQRVDALLIGRPSFTQGGAGMQFAAGTRAEAVLASLDAHVALLAELKAMQPADLQRRAEKLAA